MIDAKIVIAPEGLNRILKAVGKEHCSKNLNPQALAECIEECIELYYSALECHNDKLEMSQRRRLKLILDRTKWLRQMMKDDNLWRNNLGGARAAIQALQDVIARELAEREYDKGDLETSWRHSFQARSPFEALFGDWLPIVYTELGFSGSKTPSELASKKGPFIRFARAIAGEMKLKKAGRPYAANSFIKAVKDVAAGKVRRALPRERSEVEYYADIHRDRLRSFAEKSIGPVKKVQAGQSKIEK